MRDHTRAERAVGFLLGLIDEETAERVRARIGHPGPEHPEAARRLLRQTWTWAGDLPSSVLLWMLQEDDPNLNALVWRLLPSESGLGRAIARGVPFGPGRTEAVAVDRTLWAEEPEPPENYVRHGLVGALRTATAMAPARAAASMVVTRADWLTVADADREHPLPGYARWALAVRPDCPPTVRAQFGAHPKFTHRVRQAGVLEGPAEYASEYGPAAYVLQVLTLGHVLFPARVHEAADCLRALVHDHLGGREEAWAVLAQLVETFHGNVPELVVTAGAIA
ncbi:hypothetical protein ACWCQN_29415 [Streptomyces sp. NPDC001984]|uniref:hypothetical protein n=1 Tax=Streptomyces sp. NPDC002619 TaxID=3364655 RepID=UPI00369A0261